MSNILLIFSSQDDEYVNENGSCTLQGGGKTRFFLR